MPTRLSSVQTTDRRKWAWRAVCGERPGAFRSREAEPARPRANRVEDVKTGAKVEERNSGRKSVRESNPDPAPATPARCPRGLGWATEFVC